MTPSGLSGGQITSCATVSAYHQGVRAGPFAPSRKWGRGRVESRVPNRVQRSEDRASIRLLLALDDQPLFRPSLQFIKLLAKARQIHEWMFIPRLARFQEIFRLGQPV